MSGYHKKKIAKGELGYITKVQEEVDEYMDAAEQDIKIMEMLELADIYGALEEVAKKQYNLTMDDLKKMSDVTKKAFQSGERN
jgi:hypothetical protein